MIGRIIGAVIIIAIGAALAGPITHEINNAGNASNVTGAAATVFQFIPILFIMCLVMVGIGIAISALRSGGVLGSDEEETEEEEEDFTPKVKKSILPHKQTYEEYIKERLAVEKMMSKT